MLTSIVVDDGHRRYSTEEAIVFAYFHCSYSKRGPQGSQKTNDLLLSLLKQLARSYLSSPAAVRVSCKAYYPKLTRPSRKELVEALPSVATSSSKTFVMLHALDELSDGCRSQVLPALFEMWAETNMNILVTSRPILGVEEEFRECPSHDSLEFYATDEDVKAYLKSRICELKVSASNSLRDEIVEGTRKALKGMYVITISPHSSKRSTDYA